MKIVLRVALAALFVQTAAHAKSDEEYSLISGSVGDTSYFPNSCVGDDCPIELSTKARGVVYRVRHIAGKRLPSRIKIAHWSYGRVVSRREVMIVRKDEDEDEKGYYRAEVFIPHDRMKFCMALDKFEHYGFDAPKDHWIEREDAIYAVKPRICMKAP